MIKMSIYRILIFQTTTASHEELSVLPSADSPQRPYMPSLQGKVQVQEPEETQEEGLKIGECGFVR